MKIDLSAYELKEIIRSLELLDEEIGSCPELIARLNAILYRNEQDEGVFTNEKDS